MGMKLGGGRELSSMVNNSQLEIFGTRQRQPPERRERREPVKWWQEVRLGAPVHTRQSQDDGSYTNSLKLKKNAGGACWAAVDLFIPPA